MTRLFHMLALAGLLALGLGLPAKAQTPDWLLVDADQITAGRFLILTVPLDDPAALADVAEALESQFGVELAAEWPLNSIAVHCLVFDASGQADIEGLIADMRADARVRTAQRMQDFNVFEQRYSDPLFPLQWSLDRMNAARAHLVSTGMGVRIGVIDTGIDADHPDLMGGLLDKRDFVSVTPTATAEAHGTAVAGVIAADATNAAGIVGIAPQAQIVGLRACWQPTGQPGRCNSFSLARALNFAILNEIDVLNLSLGGPSDPLIEELILAALEAGLIVVAASGETDALVFPASVTGVIAAGGAAQGRIPAPTADVISTAPGNRYRYVDGSSIAAAHVSGVAALLLAQRNGLTPAEIASVLTAAITLTDEMPMLDACKALSGVSDAAVTCLP